jgi:hypothetical protein
MQHNIVRASREGVECAVSQFLIVPAVDQFQAIYAAEVI